MKIAIIANGSINKAEKIKTKIPKLDMVICCDGGVRHLKNLGLEPDLIIGDFDSVNEQLLEKYRKKGVPIKTYPKVKDETDTEIAANTAIELGASHVVLLGALGYRWDHSYANIMVLVKLAKQGINAVILDSNNQIQVSNTFLFLTGKKGQIISLLPLGEDVSILSTKGLRYPIENQKLPLDAPYGISNIFIEEKAEIKIKSGWLLAVLAED
jgi:thiamine pyrophosphokinase